MDCYLCDNKIEGKPFDHHTATCHPVTLYNKVKICSKCHHFPSNNTKSKETLIK